MAAPHAGVEGRVRNAVSAGAGKVSSPLDASAAELRQRGKVSGRWKRERRWKLRAEQNEVYTEPLPNGMELSTPGWKLRHRQPQHCRHMS